MSSKDKCRSFLCRLDNEREFVIEGPADSDPDCRISSVFVGTHPKTKMVVIRMVLDFGDGLVSSQEIALSNDAAQHVAALLALSKEKTNE